MSFVLCEFHQGHEVFLNDCPSVGRGEVKPREDKYWREVFLFFLGGGIFEDLYPILESYLYNICPLA